MPLPTVSPGDLITSASWNNMTNEVNALGTKTELLTTSKVNKAGDIMTGPLTIGANLKTRTLSITDQNNVIFPDNHIGMADNIDGATKWLHIGGITDAGARRIALFADRTFVSGRLGIGTVDPSVALDVNGIAGVNSLRLNGSGNSMSIFKANTDFKINLGFFGLSFPGAPPFAYKFRVGHDTLVLAGQEPFVTRFSIDQDGKAVFTGAKTGYVVDFFINNVGDPVEEGDVVIISNKEVSRYYGTNNNIPIPEVDLTDRAYDTRVCGIVARVVVEDSLPPVDPGVMTETTSPETKSKKKKDSPPTSEMAHPFQGMGATAAENFNHRVVQPNQLGDLVTLGAFAHCKVDADIAPIEPGDLLTTSPTKGHAQKVTDIKKATGAIIGKALAGLKNGKGKIPVMVLMQ